MSPSCPLKHFIVLVTYIFHIGDLIIETTQSVFLEWLQEQLFLFAKQWHYMLSVWENTEQRCEYKEVGISLSPLINISLYMQNMLIFVQDLQRSYCYYSIISQYSLSNRCKQGSLGATLWTAFQVQFILICRPLKIKRQATCPHTPPHIEW